MHNNTIGFIHLKLEWTPSRSILVPLPWANIYHCLKVHLLIHQSFRDLRCLLEMDVVYRKDSVFTTWLNIKLQVSIKANRVHLCKAFPPLPGALMASLLRCSVTEERVFGGNDWTYHLLCHEPKDSQLFWSSSLWPSLMSSDKNIRLHLKYAVVWKSSLWSSCLV